MTHGYKPPLHKNNAHYFQTRDTWVSVEFGTTSTASLEMRYLLTRALFARDLVPAILSTC
jgi:hypothetical protein